MPHNSYFSGIVRVFVTLCAGEGAGDGGRGSRMRRERRGASEEGLEAGGDLWSASVRGRENLRTTEGQASSGTPNAMLAAVCGHACQSVDSPYDVLPVWRQ